MWKPANSHTPAGSGHLGTYCEWPRRCQASFFRNAAHTIARLRPIRTNMKLLGSGTRTGSRSYGVARYYLHIMAVPAEDASRGSCS